MSQIPHTSPFDGIRHEDEDGKEFWSARELYKLLGYSTWQKFQNAIEQAKIACENSEEALSDHFNLKVKIVKAGVTNKAPRRLSPLTLCVLSHSSKCGSIQTNSRLGSNLFCISDTPPGDQR